MIIDCISDLHGHYPQLEGGDLLIVAGDLTARDSPDERLMFLQWLADQKYRKKVWIGGNHDNSLVGMSFRKTREDAAEYLCDSGTEFEGLKIWGSPWTLRFDGINPHCMAFTCSTEEELADKWALIPEDTDILVTHGPPFGLLDINKTQECVGSVSLRNRAFNLEKIKLFIFGHVHEMGGRMVDLTCMKVVNASHVDERYQPVNKPIRIEL